MGPSLAEILPRNPRPDCLQVPSKSARKANSKTNQQASRFVRTPTQKFPARSTAFLYPVNHPGRPILRPAIRQAISLVVGPSLARNRPTAGRAPSMGFGTKSGRKSAEHRPTHFRPDCHQLLTKSVRQTSSKTSQQANHIVGCGAKLGRRPTQSRPINLSVAILVQELLPMMSLAFLWWGVCWSGSPSLSEGWLIRIPTRF